MERLYNGGKSCENKPGSKQNVRYKTIYWNIGNIYREKIYTKIISSGHFIVFYLPPILSMISSIFIIKMYLFEYLWN